MTETPDLTGIQEQVGADAFVTPQNETTDSSL